LADGSSWGDKAKSTAMLPVKAASVTTGLVVGVPVAVMRRASNRCIENTNTAADHIGGHESGPPVVLASVVGMPVGLFRGTGEGIYQGTKNAFQSKPFSLESISLAENLGGDFGPAAPTHNDTKPTGANHSGSQNSNADKSAK
jgi:hypothetical protein